MRLRRIINEMVENADVEALVQQYIHQITPWQTKNLGAKAVKYDRLSRYYRVYKETGPGQNSIISFVDQETGDLFNAKSWKQVGRKVGNLRDVLKKQ